MGSLFGTDGIRGTVGDDLTADLAVRVAKAVASACRDGVVGEPVARPKVVVGRDTRPSGPMLTDAIVRGLCEGGADALLAGIIPTPAVAYLVGDLDAHAGIVLSASHNPARDNGIKLFGPGGWKLDDATEDEIERRIDASAPDTEPGRAAPIDAPLDRYAGHVGAAVTGPLNGLDVVADCADGAAFEVAPRVLGDLGADVTALFATDDGEHINDGCGATHPEVVAEVAKRSGAIGLTFDGDADRVLAVDEDGNVLDGDAIVSILASDLRERDLLPDGTVVMTVMSNQAMRAWCEREKITFVETPVGDRAVLRTLRDRGLILGGEQSGHVIRLDLATTGDGLLTALSLLDVVRRTGKPLADLVAFRPFPQVLINVRTQRRDELTSARELWDVVADAERDLGSAGRVLIRPSGTEPLVRVMVEAETVERARSVGEAIAAVVERTLNGRA